MKLWHIAAILTTALMVTTNAAGAAETPPIELTMISQHAAQDDVGAQLLYGLAYLEGRYNVKRDL